LKDHKVEHNHAYFRLISLEDALAAIQGSLINHRPEIEEINIVDSPGRVLAEDIYAPSNVPAQNVAALDGIAVNSEDLANASHQNPVKLYLKKSYADSINRGEAAPIATGMVLPKGADAVVRYERFRVEEDYVTIIEKVNSGKDVMMIGEEVKEGELLLRAGCIITPEIAAMLMEFSIKKIRVARKPRLAIISVGDELCEGYKNRGIEAINYSYIISRKALEDGADVVSVDVVPDDENEFTARLLELLKVCDVVFVSGGCSIGPNDIVPRAIKSISNVKLVFHGIKCYPGKPAGYAMINDKPLLMMPGHVVSMYVSYQIFGKKILRSLMGIKEPTNAYPAVLGSEVRGKPGLTSLILVDLEIRNGELYAIPLRSSSSSFKSLLKADGYVLVDGDKALRAGEKVLVNAVR